MRPYLKNSFYSYKTKLTTILNYKKNKEVKYLLFTHYLYFCLTYIKTDDS